MRRKYRDCQIQDGNCTKCDLVPDWQDCQGKLITKLEWARLAAGLSQKDLAEASGVNARQIRRVELGEAEAGNLTAKNLMALADILGVDPRKLI